MNINKYKVGNADKSNIPKDLKSRGGKDIQNIIKNKIEEIQFKLNKFENMAKTMAKEMEDDK